MSGNPWSPLVYVIAEQDGPRKIGASENPTQRLINLKPQRQTLSIVASFPRANGDGRLVERVAHQLLAAKRVEGEWFNVNNAQAVRAVKAAIRLVDAGDLSILVRANPPMVTRLPRALWNAVQAEAKASRRSAANELAIVVEEALAARKEAADAAAKPTRKAKA